MRSRMRRSVSNQTINPVCETEADGFVVIVHRLVACLAFLLRFSPAYDSHLAPLLEVLQAKETLKSKLSSAGFSPDGVKGTILRKLIADVADGLC